MQRKGTAGHRAKQKSRGLGGREWSVTANIGGSGEQSRMEINTWKIGRGQINICMLGGAFALHTWWTVIKTLSVIRFVFRNMAWENRL